MKPECPKCKSDDFDVLDQDVDIKTQWVSYICVCNNCNEKFEIDADIVINLIRPIK